MLRACVSFESFKKRNLDCEDDEARHEDLAVGNIRVLLTGMRRMAIFFIFFKVLILCLTQGVIRDILQEIRCGDSALVFSFHSSLFRRFLCYSFPSELG